MDRYLGQGGFVPPGAPTFDMGQFAEVELVGTLMQFKEAKTQFWGSIGIGGSIIARPLVYRDTIYAGACDKNFYALTVEGKEKWRFPTKDVISFWAIAQGGLLYFTSFDKNLYVVTEEGELAWTFQTNGHLHGAPAYHRGMVYLCSTDGNVYALEARNGRLAWKFSTKGALTMPAVGEDRIYVGGEDRTLYCLTLEGRVAWKALLPERVIAWPAVLEREMVVVGCWNNTVYAFDALTGTQKWTFKTLDAAFPRIAWKGRLYFGGRDFNCYCLDAVTGKELWRFKARGLTGMIPCVAEGRAYFPSMDQNLYCLDARTGELLWRFKADGPIVAVAVDQGRAYFGSWDCHLYCIDAVTGRSIWTFKTSMGSPSPLAPPDTGLVKAVQITIAAEAVEEGKEAYRVETLGQGSSSYVIKSDYVVEHKYTKSRKVKSMSSGWEND